MVLLAIFDVIWPLVSLTSFALAAVAVYRYHNQPDPDAPVSVNYFPSRQCNYSCGFCFHTETTSNMLTLDKAKQGLRLLKEAGMRKLNIAGGEPFLHPRSLAQILEYCKEELHVDSVSIISNGSKIRRDFLAKYGKYIDILGISCDSFVGATNEKIGRGEDGDAHIQQLSNIATWCKEYGIKLKINTVVNAYNWDEDMTAHIAELAPFRWKVFQCLIVEGENEDETRVRDARRFLVTDEQWQTFCERHKHLECYIPEDNETMANSYLNLDEDMCFLDKGEGRMKRSGSILDIGVKKAMEGINWDKEAFQRRGGVYDWSKEDGGCASGLADKKELEW
ncbi:unnamed protein product [Periconia digitata]|uniref:Radical SAM core domain-containing protein n=1 Tax=Periconia digitata TaxID=1303443 RepID=A0A9W4UFU3_9PLEO|nr:unnamed protein product [Periconia digitata]